MNQEKIENKYLAINLVSQILKSDGFILMAIFYPDLMCSP